MERRCPPPTKPAKPAWTIRLTRHQYMWQTLACVMVRHAEGVRDDGAQMYTGLDPRTMHKRTSDRGSLKSPRSVLSKNLSGVSGSALSTGSSRHLNGAASSPGGSEDGCACRLLMLTTARVRLISHTVLLRTTGACKRSSCCVQIPSGSLVCYVPAAHKVVQEAPAKRWIGFVVSTAG